MNQATTELKPEPAQRKWMLGGALAALLLLLLAAGWYYQTQTNAAPARPATIAATAQDVEEKWGIRVTQIATTADGGMVDFRYQVVDPDKALAMMDDLSTTPVLVAEDSGTLVNSAAMMANKHDLHAGVIYFLLFRNTDGSIKAGRPVSVVIGDLRLEHVIAR